MKVQYGLEIHNPSAHGLFTGPTPAELRRALWAALRDELIGALLFATAFAGAFTALAMVLSP